MCDNGWVGNCGASEGGVEQGSKEVLAMEPVKIIMGQVEAGHDTRNNSSPLRKRSPISPVMKMAAGVRLDDGGGSPVNNKRWIAER